MEQSRYPGRSWTAILALPPLGALAGWWIMHQGMGGLFCFLTLMILAPFLIGSVITRRSLLAALAFNISVAFSIVFLNLTLYLTPGVSALTAFNRDAPVFGGFIIIAVTFSFLSFLPKLLRADMRKQVHRQRQSSEPHDSGTNENRLRREPGDSTQ